MKIIEHLKDSKKPLFSFELLPPLKGHKINSIYKTIDNLIEFKPNNVNITYHQEEVVYKKRENGLLERKTVRKRPGTVAISAAIKNRYPDIYVVPHIICGGFSKDATEYALIDLNFLGIHNVLVLRGDPPKSEHIFKAETDGHKYAIEMVEQIMNMNKGIYLDDDLENITATDFSVGVAGYPEKHVEAPNINTDLKHLKQKVDAGADYIVTQMFFDNQHYFKFVEQCREIGIKVPIIPGIKPISSLRDILLLPKVFNIDIPNDLMKELDKCSSNKDAFQLGVEWGIQQSKELLEYGVQGLHYFTIGISDNIRMIAKEVF